MKQKEQNTKRYCLSILKVSRTHGCLTPWCAPAKGTSALVHATGRFEFALHVILSQDPSASVPNPRKTIRIKVWQLCNTGMPLLRVRETLVLVTNRSDLRPHNSKQDNTCIPTLGPRQYIRNIIIRVFL